MNRILIITLLSVIPVVINAQQVSIAHYAYLVHKTFDNMLLDIMPKQINVNYYAQLSDNDVKHRSTYLLVDTICRAKYLKVYTKKARNGYLYVNKSVIDFIKKQQRCLANDIEITYLLNGKGLSSKEDVMFLIKLSMRKIKKIHFNYSESDKSLVVDILTM